MKLFGYLSVSIILFLSVYSDVKGQDTWYSYQTGEWGDFNTWTLDGATAPTFVNPSSETPGVGDHVIIRNAHAVSMENGSSVILNSVTIASIVIRTGSSLDLMSSSGHNFTDISGGGTLYMIGVRNENGDGIGANDVFEENLPNGDYTDFADALLGGTIEINTGSNNIPFLFNDNFAGITATADGGVSKSLRINMGDANDRVILQRDLALTGDLIINQGNFQIHSDNAETFEGGTFGTISNTNLDLLVNNDVSINTNGQITTGTANQRHQFQIDGDFINEGVNTTSFTQRVTQTITTEATNGIVDLNFLNSIDDQNIICNGPTIFYRIEIDKGNQAIELNIEASTDGYFKLLGYANQAHGYISQLVTNTNALGLISGAVRLGLYCNVEPLNGSAGNYNVSENAALIVDGAFVSKQAGPAIVPYGLIEVESGTLVSQPGSGITTRDNGTLRVNGGDVYISQFRTSVAGASAVGGYEQNGGEVTVGDFSGIVGPSGTSYSNSNPSADYYTFSLTYPGNVFVMSGGVLSVTEPSDADQGSIFINSTPDNYSVTGGTVNVYSTADGEAKITSNAPFFNMNLSNSTTSTAATAKISVKTGTSAVGSDPQTITDPDLVIINDLTLETGTLRTSGDDTYGTFLDLCPSGTSINLYVGRNLTINNSAVLDVFSGNADNAGSSAITFNGTLASTFTIGDITTYDLSLTGYIDPEGGTPYTNWELPLYDLTIDKPNEILTLATTGTPYDAGTAATISDGSGNKNIYDTRSNILKVSNNFVLEDGSVDLDLFSLRLYGEVTNKGILGLDAIPVNAQVKMREETAGSTRTITTTDGAEFGNLRVNSGDGLIAFTSDVYVKRLLYKHGRIDIGTNNLKIDNLVFALNGAEVVGNDFSVEDMIIMDGNASDGGLSLYVPAVNNPGLADSEAGNPTYNARVYLFPIGNGTTNTYPGSQYTPLNLRLDASGFTDDGYITVNVVNSQLQTAGPHPLGNDVLNRYFRIRHEGFGTVPKIERMRFTVTEVDIPDGTNDTEMIDTGAQIWNPAWILDDSPYTRNYERKDGANGSSGFNDSGGSQQIYIFFWGNLWNGSSYDANPAGGFDLVEANYTAGLSTKFSGEPRIFYTRRPGDGFTIKWNNGNNWTFAPNDIDGNTTIDDYELHDTRQPAAGDYPQAGDVAVIGWVPYGDPGGTDGDPHGIAVDGISVDFAEIRFSQMKDNIGNPTDRQYAYNFQFRPTVVINNSGGQLNGSVVSGEGILWMRWGGSKADPDFSTIDIGDFVGQDSSYFVYETKGGVYNNVPSEVPNLLISGDGWGANDRNFELSTDITIRQDFELLGDINLILSQGATGDIIVQNDLKIFRSVVNGNDSGGNGRIDFPNNASRSIEIFGDLKLENAQAIVRVANPNTTQNKSDLIIHGNITQDVTSGGGLQLYSANNQDYVELTLKGSGTHRFDPVSGADPTLYTLVLNKGNSTASSFEFASDVSFPSPSGIGEQPIELVNGLLILNDPGITITLTDASTGNFKIPNTSNPESSSGSAGLEVRQGAVFITGADTGLELDGPLILSGGDADFADGTNNNFIQYSVGGSARITMNNANSELRVGTQIRRTTFSTAGVLTLQISAGNLFIGEGTGGEASRGVLEIVNTGSSFTHTGGTITLLSDNNYGSSPTTASLFLEPTTSNLTGSTIVVDLTNNDQDFTINSTIALNNLTLQSTSGGGSETVELQTRPLTINGDLQVQNDIELISNNLNLTLLGDFILTGTSTYTAGINTTKFTVGTSQTNTLSGATNVSFYNFTKNGSGTLNLGGDISVSGATFNLSSGTLNDNGNVITFTGQQFTNDATHSSPSNSNSTGIIFSGSAQQVLKTNATGIFGNLNINNVSGVALPDVSQEFRINNRLVLDEGVIDIGPALFVFSAAAEIVGDAASEGIYGSEFVNFSESNQIQTNSSIIDFGVEKEFNASTTTDFTFPVGEATRYTPVEISFSTAASGTSGSTSGSVRVRPRNSVAPIMLSESQAVQDAILQYYWLINSTDLTGFEADLIFNYDDEVIGTDPESSYEGALAFFADTDNGVSDGIGTVNTTLNTITIPINMPISVPADSLTNDENFSGEYFAGDPATIPDEFVAILFDNFTGNGNVNDPDNYCFDSDGDGSCDGEVRPTDFSAEITGGLITLDETATMTFNVSNVTFSRTTIPNDATIIVAAGTSGHNLGQVSGSGTIQINSNTSNAALPVGDYASFFTSCVSGGGALVYGGTGNYTVLNETNIVRNLLLSGTGSKTMVSNNVNICEDFTIENGSINFSNGFTVTVNRDFILTDGTVNLAQNGTLTIVEDLTLTAGTINGATNTTLELQGNLSRTTTDVNFGTTTTLEITGTSQQQITGTFTTGNELGSLLMNNNSGLKLNNDVEVTGTLTFTDGVITTSRPTIANPISTAGTELFLSTSATTTGSSDNSYVSGMITKKSLGTSSNFTFPVGHAGFLAPIQVSNPTVVTNWTVFYLYSNPQNLSNNINFGANRTISELEYWVVNGTGSATIAITYGEQSGVANPLGLSISRLKDDNTSGTFTNADEWTNLDVNNSSTDKYLGTLTTTQQQPFSTTIFTVGEQQSGALPIELTSFQCVEQPEGLLLQWETATETENYGFTLLRSQVLENVVNDTSWVELDFIKGAGTTTEIQNYELLDRYAEVAGTYAYKLKQIDFNGKETLFGPIIATKTAPEKSNLLNNYPNPFNPVTTIPYELSRESRVRIEVFDILGRRVSTLVNKTQPPGRFLVTFDGTFLASGTYIIRMVEDGKPFYKKILLVK